MANKIEQLYAFVSEDEHGDEGVCAFVGPDGRWMPMVGADEAMVERLMPVAREIAETSGMSIRLVHFSLTPRPPVVIEP